MSKRMRCVLKVRFFRYTYTSKYGKGRRMKKEITFSFCPLKNASDFL
jgi:hypothetical protein